MSIKIPLSRGQHALIDDFDFPLVAAHNWYATPHTSRGFYASTSGGKLPSGRSTTLYMHRLIVGAARGQYVDHINHDTLDNRRENLRIVTNQENIRNRRGANTTSKTGIRNVSTHHSNGPAKTLYYVVRIHLGRGKTYCKYFPHTEDGLKQAIDHAEIKRHELMPDTP